MSGYKRQDTPNNISDGSIINADDLDNEFDALEAAFSVTGHTHDGTVEMVELYLKLVLTKK